MFVFKSFGFVAKSSSNDIKGGGEFGFGKGDFIFFTFVCFPSEENFFSLKLSRSKELRSEEDSKILR